MIKGLIFILVMAYSLPSFSWVFFGNDNETAINSECDLVGIQLYLKKDFLQDLYNKDMYNGEQEYFQNINVEEFNCDESVVVGLQAGIKLVEGSGYIKKTHVCVSSKGFTICESLKTGERTTTKIEEVSEAAANEEEEEDSWFNWSW